MKTRKPAFKLFGYAKADRDNEDILTLREVTVQLDAKGAESLAYFFTRCAEAMKNDPKWEHEHFNGGGATDIIVYNKNA
jgi:hypothetical protein